MVGTRPWQLVLPLLIVMILGALIGAAMWSMNGYDNRVREQPRRARRTGHRRY